MFAKRSAIQNKFQLAIRTVNAQRYKIRAAIGPELANSCKNQQTKFAPLLRGSHDNSPALDPKFAGPDAT